MFIDSRHDGSPIALLGQLDVALDLLNDLHHIYLLSGDDISNVGVNHHIFFINFLVFKLNCLMLLVFTVLVQCLKAKVLPIIDYVALLTTDNTFACFDLIDFYRVVIEKLLLIFLHLLEKETVDGCNILDKLRIDAVST